MTAEGQQALPRGASGGHGPFSAVAPGVWRLGVVFVNAYAVETPGGGWILIDTGPPGFSNWVRRAAERQFGTANPPAAVVLTHGHFDHAGNAKALADAWGVPIYAHDLELPYLTGRADYPPADPTPGGAICFMARFFPTGGFDFGPRVSALPGDGSVPGLPGWRWLHTPGHSRGHVSLYRAGDRTLIAGDAFATTDLDSWASQLTWAREFRRPPTPFTPDWESAGESVRKLAGLDPYSVGAGHGRSVAGPDVAEALRAFARAPLEPPGGRYAGHPVAYRPDGAVASVPPPAADALPKKLLVGSAFAVVALAVLRSLSRKRVA